MDRLDNLYKQVAFHFHDVQILRSRPNAAHDANADLRGPLATAKQAKRQPVRWVASNHLQQVIEIICC